MHALHMIEFEFLALFLAINISYGRDENNKLSAALFGNIIPSIPFGREIPLPFSFINDSKHWRQRAEEALALADQMNEPLPNAPKNAS
jgi:hypothetical protein